MRRFLNDLWTSSAGPGDRGFIRSLVLIVPVTLVVLVLYRDLYWGTPAPTGTAHPVQSINVALNAHYCGKAGRLSSRYSTYVFLTTRPDLMSGPFGEAIAAEAGSVAEHCRTVTDPVVVSENSLMWLARLALWMNPDLTPDGLGRLLGACRVVMLLAFGFALVRTGASVLGTLAAVLVGCAILRVCGVRDTIYPFVLTLPLLHAALYGVARSSRFVRGGRWGLGVFALAMGILTAFSASMRTILMPMCAAMFGVFLLAVFAERKHERGPRSAAGAAKPFVLAAAAFVLGCGVYVRVFVHPLEIGDDPHVSNYAYHTFAHPLVMGLAVPENSFSRREGIEWHDMVGFALARRAIPDVTYLGPQYETALLQYYGRLWRKHPREMAMVYVQKLRSTGTEIFLAAAEIGAQFGIPRGPAEWLHRTTNGVALLAFALVVFAAGLRLHILGHGGRMLILALVSLAALASFGEAFLTYSTFSTMYYGELLFFVCFAFLTGVQAVVDLVARTPFGIKDVPDGSSGTWMEAPER